MDAYLSLVAQVVPVLLLAVVVEERLIRRVLDERDPEEIAWNRRYLKRTVRLAVPVELLAIAYTFIMALGGEDDIPLWIDLPVVLIGLLGMWTIWRLLEILRVGLLRVVDGAGPTPADNARHEGEATTTSARITARLIIVGVVVAALFGRKR